MIKPRFDGDCLLAQRQDAQMVSRVRIPLSQIDAVEVTARKDGFISTNKEILLQVWAGVVCFTVETEKVTTVAGGSGGRREFWLAFKEAEGHAEEITKRIALAAA